MAYDFKLNKVYKFATKAPGVLPAVVSNAKLIAITDYSTASRQEHIRIVYRNVYPLLPPGTPDQPESCLYYRFKTENGSELTLADQWIDDSSVELIEAISLRVNITDISVEDISRIRDALLALGYTTMTMTQV